MAEAFEIYGLCDHCKTEISVPYPYKIGDNRRYYCQSCYPAFSVWPKDSAIPTACGVSITAYLKQLFATAIAKEEDELVLNVTKIQ